MDGEIAESSECYSCENKIPWNECKESKLECGHHCNCTWIHDMCHWCNEWIAEDKGRIVEP